jgi:hypothetical protein
MGLTDAVKPSEGAGCADPLMRWARCPQCNLCLVFRILQRGECSRTSAEFRYVTSDRDVAAVIVNRLAIGCLETGQARVKLATLYGAYDRATNSDQVWTIRCANCRSAVYGTRIGKFARVRPLLASTITGWTRCWRPGSCWLPCSRLETVPCDASLAKATSK